MGGLSRNLESQSGLKTLRYHVCILIVIDIELRFVCLFVFGNFSLTVVTAFVFES